jgi:hypothetical protein
MSVCFAAVQFLLSEWQLCGSQIEFKFGKVAAIAVDYSLLAVVN